MRKKVDQPITGWMDGDLKPKSKRFNPSAEQEEDDEEVIDELFTKSRR